MSNMIHLALQESGGFTPSSKIVDLILKIQKQKNRYLFVTRRKLPFLNELFNVKKYFKIRNNPDYRIISNSIGERLILNIALVSHQQPSQNKILIIKNKLFIKEMISLLVKDFALIEENDSFVEMIKLLSLEFITWLKKDGNIASKIKAEINETFDKVYVPTPKLILINDDSIKEK